MSTAGIDHQLVSNVPINGVIPITSRFSLSIGAPDSHYQFEATLIGDPVIESDRFRAEFAIDDNVNLVLTLTGKRVEDGSKFQFGHFALNYKIMESRPRAHFMVSTFIAICGLAGKIEIPDLVNTKLNINLPLLEISMMLHRRQTAYRLMVIEQATGKEFFLPSTVSQEETNTIAFVYHAIVDRSFVWSTGMSEMSVPATEKYLSALSAQPFYLSRDKSITETIFGQSLELGLTKVSIEDAVIQHHDEVRQELAHGDGHLVDIAIKSLSGQVRYEFLEAPRLPDTPWDSKNQALIDMESQLDTALIERYHALAASTLEGLTEEERATITARSEIGEAFLIEDSNGENV